jgi:hypothetical protein
MNLSELMLDTDPEITEIGSAPHPSWKLGSLCRYESTAHYEDSWKPLKIRLYLRHYEIKRKTPKGAWIDVWGQEKFVLDNARKRYAYTTEELARESFIARKEWQIHHLQRQLEHAQAALSHARTMTGEQA